jgi:4-amino-4-deoxy-L-arabinose transferase-like glycosyltransferase
MVDQISSNRYGKRWVRPLAAFDRVPFNRWTMSTHHIMALVFILVWYGIGLRWIWLYRHGGPFDVDESWYLSMAAEAARKGGFGGWLKIVFWSYHHSPATPGVAAALFSIFGVHPILGLLVPLSAGALTLFLIFSMGLRIGGPWMGWITLVLVATMPVFVDYSRAFQFAMGSTLATMAALYCLLRSDGMASFRWAMLFGLCVGLMPLTRSVMLAYVPGVLLAALISLLGREDFSRRLARLAGATIVAAAITAFWLVPNRDNVWGYLVGFGYGKSSIEFGPKTSLLHWEAWLSTLEYYGDGTLLIHCAILPVGVTLTAIFAVRRLKGLQPMQILREAAHSTLMGPAVLFISGTASLASTGNHGTAFHLPLLAALTLISAWGLTQAQEYLEYLQRGAAFLITCVITLLVLVPFVPKMDLRWPAAEVRGVEAIGSATLDNNDNSPWNIFTDGRGTLQRYELAGMMFGQVANLPLHAAEPIDAATSREWQKVIADTVEFIRREGHPWTPVAFGFRHIFYNGGAVQLAGLSRYNDSLYSDTVNPTLLGKSEDAYFRWLINGGASRACLLFTSAGDVNEFHPVTDSEALTSAARHADFLSFAQWKLPDGRDVVAWRRKSGMCQNN